MMDASAIRAARRRYAANVDSDVIRGYLLQALDGLADAWDEGQGAGTVAAINFTPLEKNPYREEQ